ncbi:hypothetical protein TNCT_378812 [Trichonephila clavata]|uniref:Uncharacterized protein n=1 Tax=Trichonephila clavata TaxID=2740835 RepID=A0A8X6JGJ3_TRICU|nr:hypothetical protein TNCT_378812 [Trichonephila clavata]
MSELTNHQRHSWIQESVGTMGAPATDPDTHETTHGDSVFFSHWNLPIIAAVLGTFFETKTIVNSAHTTHAKSGFPTWYVILIQVRGTNFFGKSATL